MEDIKVLHPSGALKSEYNKDNVVSVVEDEKQAMLASYATLIDEQAGPMQEVLNRLNKLSPNVAACLAVKPPVDAQLPFRLLKGHSTQTTSFKSFVALSYCWARSKDGESSDQAPTPSSIPTSPALFQAALTELKDGEGLWCDQISIDQNDQSEKETVINNMDTIYRAARVTVAVLGEETVLSAAEVRFLRDDLMWDLMANFGSEPPESVYWSSYIRNNPILARCFAKLTADSWFRRAWCSHELRLARQQIFLVNCECVDDSGGREIVRITSRLFSAMCQICSYNLESEAFAEILEPQKNSGEFEFEFNTMKIAGAFARTELSNQGPGASLNLDPDLQQQWKDRNRMLMLAANSSEIFALQAGGSPIFAGDHRRRRVDAYIDLISIIFNISEYAVSCKRTELAAWLMDVASGCSEEGKVDQALETASYELLIKFALAAGDPEALCIDGIGLNSVHGKPFWMSKPFLSNGRLRLVQIPTIPMPLVTALDESNRFATLPLYSLDACYQRVRFSKDSPPRQICRLFLKECLERDINRSQGDIISSELSKRPPTDPQRALTDRLLDLYEQLIALFVRCGPTWMLGFAADVATEDWRFVPMVDLLAWCICDAQDFEVLQLRRYWNLISNDAMECAAFDLLRLAKLVIWGDLMSTFKHVMTMSPLLLLAEDGSGAITFAPDDPEDGGEASFQVEMPLALVSAGCEDLRRVWIVEPMQPPPDVSTDAEHKVLRLVGKLRLLGNLPYDDPEDVPDEARSIADVYGGPA